MSRPEHMDSLETRLRSEAVGDGGLSSGARERLRESLASTAPEPGAPPSAIGGRGLVIAAVVLLGSVVTVVMMTRGESEPTDTTAPIVNKTTLPFVEDLGSRINDTLANVTREAPLFDEARRVVSDVNALRGAFQSRVSLLNWRPEAQGG